MYVFPWKNISYMYCWLVGPYVCNAILFRVRLVQKLVQDWVWTHFLDNYGKDGSPTNNYGLLYQVMLFRFFSESAETLDFMFYSSQSFINVHVLLFNSMIIIILLNVDWVKQTSATNLSLNVLSLKFPSIIRCRGSE